MVDKEFIRDNIAGSELHSYDISFANRAAVKKFGTGNLTMCGCIDDGR